MFNTMWWVPLAAGIEDGVNPCALMTAAVTLWGLLWLKRCGFKKRWFFLFISILFLTSFALNCGLDVWTWNKYFQIVVRWFYIVLAVGVGYKGIKFLYQWFLLIRGRGVTDESSSQVKLSPLALGLIICLAAGFLSILATVWTTNYYITVFSIYMKLPGEFMTMAFFIGLYTLVSLWVVYVVAGTVFLNTVNARLFKIIAAAILLSAALGIVDLFL